MPTTLKKAFQREFLAKSTRSIQKQSSFLPKPESRHQAERQSYPKNQARQKNTKPQALFCFPETCALYFLKQNKTFPLIQNSPFSLSSETYHLLQCSPSCQTR